MGGQAIGSAAAIALKDKKAIRDIDISKLQQQLLKDDCYLPKLKNEDQADLVKGATITVSSEQEDYPASNLTSGVTREIDGEKNSWRAKGVANEWVNVKLKESSSVSQVRITFDSNFLLNKNITLSAKRQLQQEIGAPKELVKDFTINLIKDGAIVAKKQILDNGQRLVKVDFDKTLCDDIKLEFNSTNGVEDVRVFEIRAY